jgi:hypothetical protein
MDELPFPKAPKITAKGRKKKGRRFEAWLASQYRHYHLDDTAQPMPMSGAMEFHKGDLLKKHDHEWVDEAKNQETTKLYEWWRQAAAQARGLQKPVLHVKKNLTESLTVMRTDDYFQLRLEIKQLREELEQDGTSA